MANKLTRRYGLAHLHFITFTCYRRLPLLRSVRARNAFVDILAQVRDRYRFSLAGYVVMPIHLLISEPLNGTPSTVIVSRRLRRKKRTPSAQLKLTFEHNANSLPRFLQRRFYDFAGAGSTWSLPEKRVGFEEQNRKTLLHAHESTKKEVGRSSQGLAVE